MTSTCNCPIGDEITSVTRKLQSVVSVIIITEILLSYPPAFLYFVKNWNIWNESYFELQTLEIWKWTRSGWKRAWKNPGLSTHASLNFHFLIFLYLEITKLPARLHLAISWWGEILETFKNWFAFLLNRIHDQQKLTTLEILMSAPSNYMCRFFISQLLIVFIHVQCTALT